MATKTGLKPNKTRLNRPSAMVLLLLSFLMFFGTAASTATTFAEESFAEKNNKTGVDNPIVATNNLFAGEDWQQKTNNPRYKLFKRQVSDSDYHQTKAIVEIAKPLQQVLTAFPKEQGCWKWITRCSASLVLAEDGNTAVTYSALDMPWPISDRDFVFASEIRTSDNEQKWTLALVPTKLSDELLKAVPKKLIKKHQRAESWLRYELTATDAQNTKLVIFMHTEFGGSTPASLVNGKLIDELEEDVLALLALLSKR